MAFCGWRCGIGGEGAMRVFFVDGEGGLKPKKDSGEKGKKKLGRMVLKGNDGVLWVEKVELETRGDGEKILKKRKN